MNVWPPYAAILGLLFVALSVRTLRLRRALRVPVGDGGSMQLLRAMRVHANFAEYVPLGVLLIAGCEHLGAPAPLVHALGALLVTSRLLHARGVSREPEQYGYRVAGMALTFAVYGIACSAILLLTLAVQR